MWKSQSFKIMAGILVVSAVSVLLSAADGIGQQFPNRPVTIIVPYAAGGSTDVLTRSMAAVAEKKLGVPLIISNKPGGGGVIGMTELARSKPDGYTIGTMSSGGASILVPLMQKVNYNILADFEYIFGFTAYNYGIFVKTDSRFKTLADVVKEAKANPGKVTYGTMGQLVSCALKVVDIQEKAKMTYIPYGSGAETATNLIGGHIDLAIISTDAHKFLANKDIRMLASAGPRRWATVPDVPTLKELGYDIDVTVWTAMGTPAGVAKEQLKIFYDAFQAAHSDPGVRSLFEKLDGTAPYTSGEEMKKLFTKMIADVKPLVETLRADQKKK